MCAVKVAGILWVYITFQGEIRTQKGTRRQSVTAGVSSQESHRGLCELLTYMRHSLDVLYIFSS